jgi:PAS domain S-box-containing protein
VVNSDCPREREVRLIEESVPGYGWSADPNGKFVHVSPQTLNFIGQPAENLNRIEGTDDCGWRQIVYPDDYDRVAARWLHSLRTGEPCESEYRIRPFDGAIAGSAMLRCPHAMATVELSVGTVR